MASRFQAAGIGKSYIQYLSGLQLKVVDGGVTKGCLTVLVNPKDVKVANKVFHPSVFDKAIDKAGEGMLIGSVFGTAFQTLTLSGLLAGRGFGGLGNELLLRAFPHTPTRLLNTVTSIRYKIAENNRRMMNKKIGGVGGSLGSGSVSGSGSESDSESWLKSLFKAGDQFEQ